MWDERVALALERYWGHYRGATPRDAANAEVIDGIIATDATASMAVVQVVPDYVAAGGPRQVHAVGFDTDQVVMTAIADGVVAETIAQNPSAMAI
jgi:ABC-type sugar transport system substrate-binding protein